MNKVLAYSLLLIAGLVGSQVVPGWFGELWPGVSFGLRIATMTALAFIMVHVGYEFEIDRSRPRDLAYDYGVAATAAGFPWILAAGYFVVVLAPAGSWRCPRSSIRRASWLTTLFRSTSRYCCRRS